VVSTDARPLLLAQSLAYEPELKVVFRADRAGACGCVSVSAALRCVNSILPASWQIRPGGPSLCTPRGWRSALAWGPSTGAASGDDQAAPAFAPMVKPRIDLAPLGARGPLRS